MSASSFSEYSEQMPAQEPSQEFGFNTQVPQQQFQQPQFIQSPSSVPSPFQRPVVNGFQGFALPPSQPSVPLQFNAVASESSLSSQANPSARGFNAYINSKSHASAYSSAVSSVADSFGNVKIYNVPLDQITHQIVQTLRNKDNVSRFGGLLMSIARDYAHEDYRYIDPSDRIKTATTITLVGMLAGFKQCATALNVHRAESVAMRHVLTKDKSQIFYTQGGVCATYTGPGGFEPSKEEIAFFKTIAEDFSKLKVVDTIGTYPHPIAERVKKQIHGYVKEIVNGNAFDLFVKDVAAEEKVYTDIVRGAIHVVVKEYHAVIEVAKPTPEFVLNQIMSSIDTLKACRTARGEDNTPAVVIPWYRLRLPRGVNIAVSYKLLVLQTKSKITFSGNPDFQNIVPLVPDGESTMDFCGVESKGDASKPGCAITLLNKGAISLKIENEVEVYTANSRAITTTCLRDESRAAMLTLLKLLDKKILYWFPTFVPHNLTIFVTTFDTGYNLTNFYHFMVWAKLLNLARTFTTLAVFACRAHESIADDIWKLCPISYPEGIFNVTENTTLNDLNFQIDVVQKRPAVAVEESKDSWGDSEMKGNETDKKVKNM